MTEEEVDRLYRTAWQTYVGISLLGSRLTDAGDAENGKLAHQFAREVWQNIADTTGQPVPPGIKHPE